LQTIGRRNMPPKAKADAKAKAAAAKPAAKADAKAKAAPKAASPEPKAAAKADAKAKAAPTSPAGGGAAAAKALRREEEEKAASAEAEEAKKEEEAKAEEARLKEEEERKKAEAEAEEARKQAEEEAARKKAKANGDVVLKYSMYDEKFPIKDGKITAAEIDDTYCLSDVMPGCKIHLSIKDAQEKYKLECAGEVFPYVFEEPLGTFHELEAGETYFVFVEEDETEFLKSQEKAKQAWKGVKGAATRGETCSCIEGNPCVQECDANGNSVCLDWANRFAVAKAHGWLGGQVK